MRTEKNDSKIGEKLAKLILCATLALSLVMVSNLWISHVFGQTYQFIQSTRGSFNLTSGNIIREPTIHSALSILNSNCPGELAIYIHGVWATNMSAEEQSDRLSLSLKKEGYKIPLIGFSWDSNTAFSLDDINLSKHGWDVAKKIANENGPFLAKFILDYKKECPDDKVRIIAHSLGSRVILSAMQTLDDNELSSNHSASPSKKINSVHLLGAAVNAEQISLDQSHCVHNVPALKCSGAAIESESNHFYNLYDPEDNMLGPEHVTNLFCPLCGDITFKSPYQYTEDHDALGAIKKDSTTNGPSNYHEHNVLSKIIADADSDKDKECDLRVNLKNFGYPFDSYYCTITKLGDNHLGYMGYRSSTNRHLISNSGAIEVVVTDWKNES
jgi:hypothetical protein